MQPLNSSNLDEAYFSPRVLASRNIIENIIKDGLTGIYLIGGDRGAGKTTIINFATEKYNFKKNDYQRNSKVNFITRTNVMNEEMKLIRELLSFLENAFKKNANFFEADSQIKESIEKLKNKVLFDTLIRETETRFIEHAESTNSNKAAKINISVRDIFSGGGSRERKKYHSELKKRNSEITRTQRQKKQTVFEEIIDLTTEIAEKISLTFFLDEMDKLDTKSIVEFFNENKMLLSECPITFFLIVDTKKYLDFKYDTQYGIIKNLIRKFIFIPRTSWEEYLLIGPQLLKSDDINFLKNLFYSSKGNLREIVKLKCEYNNLYDLNNRYYPREKYSYEGFEIFQQIITTDYVRSLPNEIQEYIIDFIYEVVEFYLINGSVTDTELDELVEKKTETNFILNTSIKRIAEIIRNYSLNFSKKSTTLQEEMSKYFKVKSSLNFEDNYSTVFLDTSDYDVIKRMLDIYFPMIDAVILCKEITDDKIYHTTYTANMFVSGGDQIGSKVFVNEDGFSWNHERQIKIDEMREILKEKKIYFRDVTLPMNKKSIDFLSSIDEVKELFQENKRPRYL